MKNTQPTCEKCRLWKTSKCWERKETGKDSGPDDWCGGFKIFNTHVAEPFRTILNGMVR